MSKVNEQAQEGYHDQAQALKSFNTVVESLSKLDSSDKKRVISSVLTFLNLGDTAPTQGPRPTSFQPSAARSNGVQADFSADRSQTPKQFMIEKQPRTDVERIACLAYYLTHFRDMPHFKTIDITKLNTEAAQPKFSNPTRAAGNALDYGYLAQATKGNRQLSAGGELFVQALPDRESAKTAMAGLRPKRSKSNGKKRVEEEGDEN